MACPFCLEMADARYGRALLGDRWPFDDRVLLRANEAWAIAGIAPQVYPYVLIITRRHITSIAESDYQERKSILDLLDGLLELKLFASSELIVFEHGGKVGNRCSCLEHCHLHIIDGAYPIVRWFAD